VDRLHPTNKQRISRSQKSKRQFVDGSDPFYDNDDSNQMTLDLPLRT
jgi:hypothetical protein